MTIMPGLDDVFNRLQEGAQRVRTTIESFTSPVVNKKNFKVDIGATGAGAQYKGEEMPYSDWMSQIFRDNVQANWDAMENSVSSLIQGLLPPGLSYDFSFQDGAPVFSVKYQTPGQQGMEKISLGANFLSNFLAADNKTKFLKEMILDKVEGIGSDMVNLLPTYALSKTFLEIEAKIKSLSPELQIPAWEGFLSGLFQAPVKLK